MSPSQPPPPQSVSHRLPWNSRLIRFRAHLQPPCPQSRMSILKSFRGPRTTADNFIDLAYRREQHAALTRHPAVICLTHFRKILIGQRHAHLHKPLSRQQHISRHYPGYLPCIPSLLEECPKSFHRVFEIRLYFRQSELLNRRSTYRTLVYVVNKGLAQCLSPLDATGS